MESNFNPYENSPEGEEPVNNQNNETNDFHDNLNNSNHTNYNPYTTPNYGYGSPQFQPRNHKRNNFFETASIALGIGAIISCVFFYGAYIMGAMAILFALLSRGGQMKMSSKARIGLILGICAIVLSTVITIAAIYIVLEEFGSFENILRNYCDMYGLDFEQEFGILFE